MEHAPSKPTDPAGVVPHPSVVLKPMMGNNTVASFVWDEARHANWGKVNPDGPGGRRLPTRRNEMMLAVMTYAYSAGIYRSREIEAELLKTQAAQAFFGDVPITASSFRQFRRYNRDLVADCMEHVMERIFRLRGHRPAAVLPAQAGGMPECVETVVIRPLLEKEADRRIQSAIEQDCLESDD